MKREKTGLEVLQEWGACQPSLEWARQYKGKPAEQAWNECDDIGWLEWLADCAGVDWELRRLAFSVADHFRDCVCLWCDDARRLGLQRRPGERDVDGYRRIIPFSMIEAVVWPHRAKKARR